MPELDYITVKGFKSIKSIEKLKLGSINILIGANGSGKTNFIEVFSFLHALREGHLQNYVMEHGGADNILHFGSKETQKIELEISFRDEENKYNIILSLGKNDNLYPKSEVVSYWMKSYPQPLDRDIQPVNQEAGISNPDLDKIAGHVRKHLDRWRLYHFHDTSSASPMKRTSNINDNRFLSPDGSNLAAFLYFLKAKYNSSYRMIVRTIQSVAPFFEDFVLEPQLLNPEKIGLEWRHKNSREFFNASSFSDGTLRFIALTTLFLQPHRRRPSVILVDEPELGLHPFAITKLASLIETASSQTQVIISTQSSLLLDNFSPEDVLVANRVDGRTQLMRLASDEIKGLLEDDYSLGQLWEKNEFDGRPATE